MNKIFLLIMCIYCFSCTETTKKAVPNSANLNKITWEQYKEWCGGQNIISDKNFEKLMGKTVTWKGTIYSVAVDANVEELRQFSPKVIRVKMKDSGSLMADVSLRVIKDQAAIVNTLKKGDYILFRGTIKYLGGMEDHILEVSQLKKTKEPKAKKKK